MLNNVVELSLKNRFLVMVLFAVVFGLGIHAMIKTSIDAFPDTTPVQVQINTVAPSLNPIEIEQQITVPVELSLSGLPGLKDVRSISKFGLSQIVATFKDGTHIYDARQLILEHISGVGLPEGIERPQLGPISTGLGEVFHYIVRSKNPTLSLDEIRTLHDWVIKPEMRKVPGVAEVNSWGGYELQYQVIVEPSTLVKYNLTLEHVIEALQMNNGNVGGGRIVTAGQSYLVHGKGRVTNLEEIGNIMVSAKQGIPIKIRNVAEVKKGHEIRRGAVTENGNGEAVLGLCFMLMGENSKTVTESLKKQLDNVRKYLPKDVEIELVYDRTDLVNEVIGTVKHNLVAGGILVVVVLFLIQGSIKAGMLVSLVIPISLLFAFFGMYQLSIAASLLSLGALDFGILVDGSIVMTDMQLKGLYKERKRLGRKLTSVERLKVLIDSSREVLRPIVFGMGIIVLIFVPILSLQGIEGKMFQPMAWTFIFALAGALIFSITLTPVLSYYFLPKDGTKKQGLLVRLLHPSYAWIVSKVMVRRKPVLIGASILLIATVFLASRLGGAFIPRLSEGGIVINAIRLAGVSIEESVRYNSKIEAFLLKEFPNEIKDIWSRIGTAEVATDPMGTELTDIFITLKPRKLWKKAHSQSDLTAVLDKALKDFPGINMVFTQPIEMRMNEMISGVRSDIAIKVFGDDFDKLVEVSDEIQKVLVDMAGAADVSGEQITGQPTLEIKIRQNVIARLGISAKTVLDIVAATGNYSVGDIVEGQRRFPLVVRLPDKQRTRVKALANTLIPSLSGALVPLHQVAEIIETEGPATINREWGRRLIKVQCNVRDRDVASFVEEAKQRISERVNLPDGYVIGWGGQFENLERSKQRLMIVVPLTLLLIFVLLYLSLKSFRDVLIIYTGIPFAAIGGVFSLWIRGMPFSVSAAIGFIALSGIAVLNGQLLVSAIKKRSNTEEPLVKTIQKAAISRLEPILATAISDIAGFLPMALSVGVGAEVQRPLATVVIGGMLTSTVLTLVVLPVLYCLFGNKGSTIKKIS